MASAKGKMPKALARRQELFPDLEPIMRAYEVLVFSRPISMDGRPCGLIPIGEIAAYLSISPVPGYTPYEAMTFIRFIDAFELRRLREKDNGGQDDRSGSNDRLQGGEKGV